MAKRRKEKDEESETDFKFPKFDEEKFLKKERRNIKTTFLSFLLGLVMAIICFAFWTLLSGHFLRWELVLLVAVMNSTFLKYLFIRLNIDLTDFGKKGWLSSYATYFFTWLLVFIVLVNPPFYDDEAPKVDVVTLPTMQELGGTVKIIASISDNVGIESIDFTIVSPDGMSTHLSPNDYTYENNALIYEYPSPDNLTGESDTYTYTLNVTDVNKHSTERTGSFTYSDNTIKLPEPASANEQQGAEVTYTTSIKFDVKPDVSRFYYKIDGGKEINVTKDGDYYTTSPKIEGWSRGTNVTVKAYGEIIHYFENSGIKYNNTIVDSGTYYFNVSDVPEIGGEPAPQITLPSPIDIQVPGFEMAVFVISLIGVILIFKYSKKNKRN